MPMYESETTSRDHLKEVIKHNKCAVCGANLNLYLDDKQHKAFIACWDWPRTHHEGIIKEYEPRELNIPTRREIMEKELGHESTIKLMQYAGPGLLTREAATEIVETIWPSAQKVAVFKAVMVCSQYGLNPLMKQVFLIPFYNKETKKDEYEMVLGIKAKRVIAKRKHTFGYFDDTPRVMTEQEQIKVYGEVDKDNISAITILRDEHGNIFRGYGIWPRSENPYGTNKGNSKANMAFIRSESQALEKMAPGELPTGEIADETYLDTPTVRVLNTETGEIIEGEVREVPSPTQEGGKAPPEQAPKPPVAQQEAQQTTEKSKVIVTDTAVDEVDDFIRKYDIDVILSDINWKRVTWQTWLNKTFPGLNLRPNDTLANAMRALTPEQREQFKNHILECHQASGK